jgi:hypothetical protein
MTTTSLPTPNKLPPHPPTNTPGASGRNAGYLTSLVGHDSATLAAMLGEEKAQKTASLLRGCMAEIKGLIEEHAIDCDFVSGTMGYMAFAQQQAKDGRKQQVRQWRWWC